MKLMVRVMEEIEVTRPQQLVLLSMAENAKDDGSKCFPSVDLIAWKAGYKPRAVIDIMRELRKAGIIEEVDAHRARRATEYQIHLDRAPKKPSFEEWKEVHGRHKESVRRGAISREVQNDEGCNLTSVEVQSHVLEVQSHVKNTRENAPEPVREPVKNQSRTSHGGKTKKIRRKPDLPLPDDFTLTEGRLNYAVNEGMDADRARYQFKRMRNWADANDVVKKDWDAQWRNWVLKDIRDNGKSSSPDRPAEWRLNANGVMVEVSA